MAILKASSPSVVVELWLLLQAFSSKLVPKTAELYQIN